MPEPVAGQVGANVEAEDSIPTSSASGPESLAPIAIRRGGGPGSPDARRRFGERRIDRVMLSVIAIVAGVLIWWGVASIPGITIPTPLAVVIRGVQLCANGTLPVDVGASVARVLTGFVIGTIVAVPIGFLMGWYPVVRGLLEPYVQFFRMIPPLAIIPLAVVLLGIGEVPKIFVIFLASFLSCLVATLQGVLGVDSTLINAARVLGANDGTIFLRVIVPASSPFIFVGMRIGLGSSWATLVAAELIAAQQGLGFMMQQAQLYYDLGSIFVALISIGILGLVMDRLLMLVERKVTSWQETR